jgi:hypothetical protein
MASRRTDGALLSFLLPVLAAAALAVAAVPALGQDGAPPSGGEGTESSDTLDPHARPPTEGEDPTVYEEKPIRNQLFERKLFLSAFWSGALSLVKPGTLDFDGIIGGNDATYEADGDWDLYVARAGVRMEFGRRTMRFRLGLFFQRLFADFESDGKTTIDYDSQPDAYNRTVLRSLDTAGGGLELGFCGFFRFHVARGPDGVGRLITGPTISFAVHLSGLYDSAATVGGGFGGLDFAVGWRFLLWNRLVVFTEFGVVGGFLIGAGGEIDLALAYGVSWKGLLGLGVAL